MHECHIYTMDEILLELEQGRMLSTAPERLLVQTEVEEALKNSTWLVSTGF